MTRADRPADGCIFPDLARGHDSALLSTTAGESLVRSRIRIGDDGLNDRGEGKYQTPRWELFPAKQRKVLCHPNHIPNPWQYPSLC